jgi:hypothetical protein
LCAKGYATYLWTPLSDLTKTVVASCEHLFNGELLF